METLAVANKIVYPLALTPNGSIAVTADPVTIARGVIRSTLFTGIGERPLRPAYGTAPGIFGDRDNVRAAVAKSIETELPGIVDRWTLTTQPTNDQGVRTHTVKFEAGDRSYDA
jgi:hypothetical protein